MSITHHPDISTLMTCAAGSQPESLAAVIACHISMCPACAAEFARMQEIGVALFAGLEPVPLTREAPIAALRALEAESEPEKATTLAGDVPAPIACHVGSRLDGIPWKRIATGLWQYRIPLSKGARGELRLIKAAPGVAIPEHGHDGEELTLLLRGSYRDEFGTYRIGDMAELDTDARHHPVADEVEGCICLVANEGKTHFKGLLARFMQPFIDV